VGGFPRTLVLGSEVPGERKKTAKSRMSETRKLGRRVNNGLNLIIKRGKKKGGLDHKSNLSEEKKNQKGVIVGGRKKEETNISEALKNTLQHQRAKGKRFHVLPVSILGLRRSSKSQGEKHDGKTSQESTAAIQPVSNG